VGAVSGTSARTTGGAGLDEGAVVRGSNACASERTDCCPSPEAPRVMAMGMSTAKAPAPATMMATPHRGAPGGGGLRDMRANYVMITRSS
jgi:hypothetical protein